MGSNKSHQKKNKGRFFNNYAEVNCSIQAQKVKQKKGHGCYK